MDRIKIPQTDSIQELAHFWDTHGLTDFEDELEEVREPVFKFLPQLSVSLNPKNSRCLAHSPSRVTSPLWI